MSEAGATAIPIEFSSTWPNVLAFIESGDSRLLPDTLTVFFIAWVHRDTGKYTSWGCYMSTSEQGPHGCHAHIIAEVTVDIHSKTKDGLEAAAKQGIDLLCEKVFKDEGHQYQQIRNKLAEDLASVHKPGIGSMIEVVDEADFNQLLQGRRV